jgi:two-component system response regulator DesR
MKSPEGIQAQLLNLLTTLAELHSQIHADQDALPAQQVQAQLALAVLEEMVLSACRELEDIVALIASTEPTPIQLSPREMDVLRLAAQGMTNKEIAYRLTLSERTVQYHLNSVYNKTGTNSRAEATAAAYQKGWL